MGAFWKTFFAISSPLALIVVVHVIADLLDYNGAMPFLDEILAVNLQFFVLISIPFFALAFLALVFSEKIYPRYFKKFDETYKKEWNSSTFLVVLTFFMISYFIISFTYENCGLFHSYDSCIGLSEAIVITIDQQRHPVSMWGEALTTIGVGSGLIVSSTIILKELIPRAVFYWKSRE